MDIEAVLGRFYEMDTVMDKKIYYFYTVTLETVWLEKKMESAVSAFVGRLDPIISQKT
jgi:hypothetical protein